ncbi:hypothetical protein [Actinoplanes teichomyceticus]|uniref:Uncharacterized protein n=1 Tax=Actinoplanes teichomyceticus TaxID=1867 RepID=A0A561WQM5_ACTTI|nr:hypothetical protein [Actinoplanes teichomyceticus]TWG26145.1 hypothetical protein FHX34_1011122 [Actinoplanes teichomyceticus]GIF11222.1 hypothetical protein Ate01nite_12540 [Actinoplanes teichomyceticus]
MTEQAEQSGLVPSQAAPPGSGPWAAYLAAARELDVVRRAASSVAGEQAATIATAWQELSAVRARLAPQRARLVRDFGVPEVDLTPQDGERAAALAAVTGGPGAVLAALRQARATADAADHAFVGPAPAGPGRPWARNLLVYGPFAAAVLFVQIILYLVAPSGSLPTYTLLCGLSMPLLAFGLGWATIGFVWGPDAEKSGAPVDRTPVLGIVTCLTPVLLTCMGVGLQALFD